MRIRAPGTGVGGTLGCRMRPLRDWPLAIAFVLASLGSAAGSEILYLADAVARGELPPLAERLPTDPRKLEFGQHQQPGVHGGQLRLLMAKANDTRQLAVYGYARLLVYDTAFKLVPDILADVRVEEDRRFTLHLRKGHRWSDGAPFTAEDFRYFWEDVANDPDLSPFGPPRVLLVDGEPPLVEFPDATTVRYTWKKPNPHFLASLADARPLYIYRPAHYLKKFHASYTDTQTLATRVSEAKARDWISLHTRQGHLYKFNNPDLPSLQPWYNTTSAPAERFVFKRNPFFHRVDPKGQQLPYIDEVLVNLASTGLIPAKTGAGESDLQARYLRLDNYTFLKAGEKQNSFNVRLWQTAKGSQIALYPNLNVRDPQWRELMRNAQFRRALSLAVDRNEINQVVYLGLVIESNNTVLEQSPLFRSEYRNKWAEFNIEHANRLLDELGLTQRNEQNLRLLPDGRPMEILVHTAGENTEETDVLELIHDNWLKIGVKLYSKPSQREVFRNRVFSGDAAMSVWAGLSNGLPTADMSPLELAPTAQDQLQWPQWGQYFETKGQKGAAPDMATARRLLELNTAWEQATNTQTRERIWHEMLGIHADQMFSIGLVCGVRQPVVVNKHLRNVPQTGIYNWNPGAFFGIYQPDTFWFTEARRSPVQ
ncbi:MAG: ABC transporter substrate-binding protein [Gammaproteobacteria bacterium]|nr:ABC transporter substrate-binding protein [Gammaproteobacteria bacterium]